MIIKTPHRMTIFGKETKKEYLLREYVGAVISNLLIKNAMVWISIYHCLCLVLEDRIVGKKYYRWRLCFEY